jgi:hypothetical protein
VAPTWSHLASLNQSLTAAPTGPTQVADTTPLGSSPTHFTPPSPKAETDDPPITSNFYLIIDGITLGRWSECSGLGMKYKGQVYQQGGSITSTQYLLQKDIQTLTVTRPFGSPSMEMLHWFELYAHITIPLTATVLA